MIVIGAKGHAKEIISILEEQGAQNVMFFDDVSLDLDEKFLGTYKIVRDTSKLAANFIFVLGLGGPNARRSLAVKFLKMGGELCSVISEDASIGKHKVILGKGLNIMRRSFISNSVKVGDGCLINYGAMLHHDVEVGDYCEIAPMAQLLGGCTIGENTFIGAGAIILPNVQIGNNCIVAAGAVVTKNIKDNLNVKGVPAK